MKLKSYLKAIWYFIWHDDSLLSWIVNLILAFVIVKFIIYPGLGLVLGTSYPVVAVVSGSMEHNGIEFDEWWEANKGYYEARGINKEQFAEYSFEDGFNKGDVMIIIEPKDINKGDVIVYGSPYYPYPIIHRVVEVNEQGYETKGDNNAAKDPQTVTGNAVLGEAKLRLPWLGWVKIAFAQLIGEI
ncbi:signal peptidase I [archaeon]|nr:signal peptidase I [archaeon]